VNTTCFTGIDASLRSVSISVVDEAGTVQFEAKVAAEVEVIVAALRRFSNEIRQVGFQAGTLTQYLTYGLRAAGFEVVCLEARQVAVTLSAMRNKTHCNDARGLAQILRTGWYRTVHVKSVGSHQARALLASRKAVLAKCCDLENELRGLLKVFGVRLPMRVPHGGYDDLVRAKLKDYPEVASTLLPLLDARTVLYKTFLKLENAVRTLVWHDPMCQRLMTVPGVGPVTSLTFKSAVDALRFSSSRLVAAHFGLTPRRYQSGETDNPGRISKAGDPAVRQELYTAAHALMTRSEAWSTLKAWGVRLVCGRDVSATSGRRGRAPHWSVIRRTWHGRTCPRFAAYRTRANGSPHLIYTMLGIKAASISAPKQPNSRWRATPMLPRLWRAKRLFWCFLR
jgi:transposase